MDYTFIDFNRSWHERERISVIVFNTKRNKESSGYTQTPELLFISFLYKFPLRLMNLQCNVEQ